MGQQELLKTKRKRGVRAGVHVKSRKIEHYTCSNTQSTSSMLNRVARNQEEQMERRRMLLTSKSTTPPTSSKARQGEHYTSNMDPSTVIIAPTKAAAEIFVQQQQTTQASGVSEDSVSKFYPTSRALHAIQEAGRR